MYHSIQIIPDKYAIFAGNNYRGVNTWDDWHLIPKERPLFNPPSPKYNFMDLPGANGTVDLSDILSNGYPIYNDRTGSIEFYVMNGYKEWYQAYSDVMNYCHGERCKFILEDDPAYYYSGRISVNAWKSEKDWSKIVLDYQVDPFKYELFASNEAWRWDPFSFVDGIIMNANDWNGIVIDNNSDTVTTGNTVIKEVPVTRMPYRPSFSITCNSETLSSNSYLTIKLFRYFSSGTQEMASHTWIATDNVAHTIEYQDIVLIDYRHRYAYDENNPKMVLRFVCPEDESFTVNVTFQRGKL